MLSRLHIAIQFFQITESFIEIIDIFYVHGQIGFIGFSVFVWISIVSIFHIGGEIYWKHIAFFENRQHIGKIPPTRNKS